MDNPKITICAASVKVMRSFDYCHFEVVLGSSVETTVEAVDALRKTAARLVDKAVDQYKVAKNNAQLLENDARGLETLHYRHRDVLEKPEGERTPEDVALLKAIDDRAHRNRARYDYQDDFSEPDYGDDDSEF